MQSQARGLCHLCQGGIGLWPVNAMGARESCLLWEQNTLLSLLPSVRRYADMQSQARGLCHLCSRDILFQRVEQIFDALLRRGSADLCKLSGFCEIFKRIRRTLGDDHEIALGDMCF